MAQLNEIANSKIQGIPSGVSYEQHERVDELNKRFQSRQFADSPLKPNFDPRPVPTKYALFPAMNLRKPPTEEALPYVDYNLGVTFNPGSARGPISGFTNNIEIESVLRNQMFALQKGADQNVYIPSSNSDLYNVTIVSGPSEQPYPLLFDRTQFHQGIHANVQSSGNIGRDKFFNHTRTQLRCGEP